MQLPCQLFYILITMCDTECPGRGRVLIVVLLELRVFLQSDYIGASALRALVKDIQHTHRAGYAYC